MKIAPGTTVVCRDGSVVGTVARLIMAPDTFVTTHLVVAEGRTTDHDVMVPTSRVLEVLADRLRLDLDRQEIDQMPDYSAWDFVTPPVHWRAPLGYNSQDVVLPVQLVAVAATDEGNLFIGQEVHCSDGRAGAIGELRVQPISGRVIQIVVAGIGHPSTSAAIPSAWLKCIDSGVVKIACSLSQLQDIPHGSHTKNAATRTNP